MLFRFWLSFILALGLSGFSAYSKPLVGLCPTQVTEAFLTAPNDPAKVQEILEAGLSGKSKKYPLGKGWITLNAPLLVERPRGLEALRALINSEGLAQVISPWTNALGPESLSDFFGGTTLLRKTDYPGKAKKHPGVFLHSSGIGVEAEALNSHVGTVNPHLGFAHLHGVLADNRIAEYELAEANWPGIMSKTEIMADLKASEYLTASFFSRLDFVKQNILRQPREKIQPELESLLVELFTTLNIIHPEGTFIKNYGESTTGDLNKQITSHESDAKAIVTQFMDRVSLMRKAEYVKKGFESQALLKKLPDGLYDTATKFMIRLLIQPESLIAQKKVDIMKTPLGYKMEFRVDFIDGEPVYVKLRFSNEYFPEHGFAAGELIRAFFARLPKEFRYLSGGADVAFLADGSLSIIEFNYGSTSGSLWPTIFPIDSSEVISNLAGKPAPLIVKLDKAFAGGVPALRELLASARFEKEQWEKRGWRDISLFEYAKWIRNRYLRLWAENPTPENGEKILNELDNVFSGFGSPENKDLIELFAGAQNYIEISINR